MPGGNQGHARAGHAGVWLAFGLTMALVVGGVAWAALRHPGTTSVSTDGGGAGHAMPMPAADIQVPTFAVQAGVADVYTYAAQNYDVLRFIPCTCGCGEMGHLDNWNCYVRTINESGAVEWDQHAAGCQVCVDITRDVIELRARGTPLAEIRAFIDANYPGPATDTIPPPAA